MYDLGTYSGGMILGRMGDRYKKRAALIFPSLFIAAGLMLCIKYLLNDAAIPYYFVLFGIGIF